MTLKGLKKSHETIEKLASVDEKTFFQEFMLRNRPLILQGLCSEWNCWKDWRDHDGKANLDWMAKKFGDAVVSVVDCSASNSYNDQYRETWTFSKYVDYWKHRDKLKGLYYLKDWHFSRDFHSSYCAYTVPNHFSDDWMDYASRNGLNWETSNCNDDYRFVYCGISNTVSYLHVDVFKSYSWSANIVGRKRWYFFEPTQERFLFNKRKTETLRDIKHFSNEEFPNADKACYLEVIQEPGEIIFVPRFFLHLIIL